MWYIVFVTLAPVSEGICDKKCDRLSPAFVGCSGPWSSPEKHQNCRRSAAVCSAVVWWNHVAPFVSRIGLQFDACLCPRGVGFFIDTGRRLYASREIIKVADKDNEKQWVQIALQNSREHLVRVVKQAKEERAANPLQKVLAPMGQFQHRAIRSRFIIVRLVNGTRSWRHKVKKHFQRPNWSSCVVMHKW